ncbi:MAG: HEAT repeat domain-containing protein [Anaerolineae bacterium]|nr:HEAT repeat domain-containing protein [Anaerolineae bacterium]
MSYRSLDIEFGLKIVNDLKVNGIRMWMDKLEIRPSDDWVNALSKGVDGCTAMLALITPEYLKSPYCIRELHRAYRLNRMIFPILLQPINPEDLPLELERTQSLDFINWKDEKHYHTELTKLVHAIKSRFGDLIRSTTGMLKLPPELAEKTVEAPAVIIEKPKLAVLSDETPTENPFPMETLQQTDAEIITELINPVIPADQATELDIIGDMLNQLTSGDWGGRQEAFRLLREYALKIKGVYPKPMVERLVVLLSHEEWMVRWAIAEVLVCLGAKEAKSAILSLLKDTHQTVRMTAVRAIALLGDKTDAEALIPLLQDKQTMVREATIQTLGTLGNPKAIPALLPLLIHREEEACLYTIEALGKIGDVSVFDTLLHVLNIGDEKLRWVCAEALGNLKDARAIPHLQTCLADERGPLWEEKRICDVAFIALETIGTPEAKTIATQWKINRAKKSPSGA